MAQTGGKDQPSGAFAQARPANFNTTLPPNEKPTRYTGARPWRSNSRSIHNRSEVSPA